MTGHRQIEETAARWLARRQEPDWSEANQRALDSWLAEATANKMAYWRLEYWWKQADRIAAVGDAVLPDPQRLSGRMAVRAWAPIAMAASVALVLLTVALFAIRPSLPSRPEPVQIAQQRVETRIGGHKIIPLNDGSHIELNTATVLRAAVTPASRDVWLDRGEAYFEVKHSDKVPFRVYAGLRTVTVLGTKFSVRRDGEKVIVSVVEGRVRIDEANDGQEAVSPTTTTITKGNIAIADNGSTYVATHAPVLVENALAWRDGMLTFDQSTLGEVVEEFNRYNQRKMVIVDPEVASIRIGGNFSTSNVDGFTRFLRNTFGLTVQTSHTEIKISN